MMERQKMEQVAGYGALVDRCWSQDGGGREWVLGWRLRGCLYLLFWGRDL